MDGCMVSCMKWVDKQMGWTDRQTYVWLDGWMDIRLDVWMDR